MFGRGTATALAGLSLGASAWTVADDADETADFIRDPVGTIQRYWANAAPGSLLLDAGTLALSAWLPGKAIQHLTPSSAPGVERSPSTREVKHPRPRRRAPTHQRSPTHELSMGRQDLRRPRVEKQRCA